MRDIDDSRVLEAEARVFTRYLVGGLPPQEIVERYVAANRRLEAEPTGRHDVAVLGFTQRHPWSVPFLDGAAGILMPGGLLRRKILLMAAILEASTIFADAFLPRDSRPLAFMTRLIALGMTAAARAVIGMLLYVVIVRRAHG